MDTIKTIIVGYAVGEIWSYTGSLLIALISLLAFIILVLFFMPVKEAKEQLDPNSKEYLSKYMPKI